MIDEVTVQSKDKNRIKNYGDFDRLFLGESVNAQNCKILNTKDLYFRKDAKTDIVKGHSLIPHRLTPHPLRRISCIFAGIFPRIPMPSFFMTKELPMNSLVIRIR